MAKSVVPNDFKEFLRLLNEAEVEYLLVGGHAVGFHGYPRTTGDMDVWVNVSPENANKIVEVFRKFGFQDPNLTADVFLQDRKIIRMGLPPVRIEVLTAIDGVSFSECYAEHGKVDLDGVPVNLISLRHLRINKAASGRHKDLDDLEHLPESG